MSASAAPRFDPARRRAVTIALLLVTALSSFESTVVSTAMPTIIGELHGLPLYTWVFSIYLLASTITMPIYGRLADVYGRRRILMGATVVFLLGAVACALARSMPQLIVARGLQGLGAGGLIPIALTVTGDLYSLEERARVQAFFSGVWGFASLVGPLLGAFLTVTFGWRSIFTINVPLGLVAIFLVATKMIESREPGSDPLDVTGALTLALGIGALLFAVLQRTGAGALGTGARLFLGVLGFALLGLFARLQAGRKHPLIPPELFRHADTAAPYVGGILLGTTIYGVDTFVPLFVQGTLGYTATAIGLGSIPGTLFLIFLSTRFGTLASRYGPRLFMTVGPLFMGLGLLWLARIPADSPPWQLTLSDPSTWLPSSGYMTDILPYYLIFGIGVSIMVAPLTTALMRSVPGRQAGLASAINNAISRVGPQLAGALIFIVVTASFYATMATLVPGLDVNSSQVREDIPPINRPADSVPPDQVAAARTASTDSFHLAMLTASTLLVAGALTNGLFISNRQALAGPAADPHLVPAAE